MRIHISILLLFLAFIIISGCSSNNNKIAECEKKQGTDKDDCYHQHALDKKDKNLCSQIEHSLTREDCILTIK